VAKEEYELGGEEVRGRLLKKVWYGRTKSKVHEGPVENGFSLVN